ncbi:Restriction endonuclease XhoI [Thiohalospira halophila DSM 15071]|uniref:Restriction endonuclease XhoI n=1 Tax=Thiohalospira halophila DSM 15071 TaxID=1123397 RepID=A0A1I1NE33_9GAMM|nr:PaeR7I family type II restriction endonuclease [Thiohalospira halophila]SFC91990.1 Restriction endonuclease XhoI [Thiohalospira halophila DSM 15071]
MNSEIPNYEPLMQEAVEATWGLRDEQAAAQEIRGVSDAGTRGAVTGGKHLGPLEALVTRVLIDAGLDESCIYTNNNKTKLPGYFRELKNWDVVALKGDTLVAVIELKSQSGSFGNNLNNRIEEAVGQTVDFWQSFEKEIISGLRPWFGYLMVVEASNESTKPIGTPNSVLKAPDKSFLGKSYIERYAMAFDRMHRERLLDSVCFTASAKGGGSIEYPIPAFSFQLFAVALFNRVRQIEALS